MNREIELLRNIYVVLSIICYSYILSLVVRAYIFVRKSKKQAKQEMFNSFNQQLGDLFTQGLVKDVVDVCEERLKTEPNNTTALFWIMRVSFLDKHWTKVNELINKIRLLDPGAADGYLEPYIKTINDAGLNTWSYTFDIKSKL